MNEQNVIPTVTFGKYGFTIIDNTMEYNGRTFSRSFKIGSPSYPDCVNVTVSYNQDNRPIKAHIPTLTSHEKCAIRGEMEGGENSVGMIKVLLRHIHSKIPEITSFTFEDYSKIECGTEEEKKKKEDRPLGTPAYPVSLFYFSLAFNGMTWYEKHFHAKLVEDAQYRTYRDNVKRICGTKESKMSFENFIAISIPTVEQIQELQSYYEKADTYHEFFTSIPYERRCPLVRTWIHTFMAHILKGVFQHTDWIIDVNTMDNPPIVMGGKRGKRVRGTRKKGMCRTYYCPKGRIYLGGTQDNSIMAD